MKSMFYSVAVAAMLFSGTSGVRAQSAPHLETRGNARQLMVDGKPFIILGGELHNSSSSSAAYLSPIWANLVKMNLNTALVAVSWELVEPKEGTFDFSLVDAILAGARHHRLKVVLLWFGSWKNGLSHYVPAWVKKDYVRFPRIRLANGRSTETLTALSGDAMAADARAFGALMRHVKAVDGALHTVVMMQVENETGIIGGTRDRSAAADAAFAAAVPQQLLDGMVRYRDELQPGFKKVWEANGSKTAGTWTDVFGAAAGEVFTAWHYARYVNTVAARGKAAYDIPMFVNAWIVQPDDKQPGDYPSGGPQAHMHDVWRIGAPAIDLRCPDIYLPDFAGITALYAHSRNPLFVPESFSGVNGAANAFYAIGNHNAIGYSPFGIDLLTEAAATPLAKAYDVLSQLSPGIAEAQAKGTIRAVSLERKDSVAIVNLGDYTITARLRRNWNGVTQATKGYGVILQTSIDQFIVAGANIDVTFVPAGNAGQMAGLLSVREGRYVAGKWQQGRVLNGDDIMMSYKLAAEAAEGRTGTGVRLRDDPAIVQVSLYRWPGK